MNTSSSGAPDMKKAFLLLAAALVVFGASHVSFAADEQAVENSAASEHANDAAVEHANDASVVVEGDSSEDEGDDAVVDEGPTDDGSDVTSDEVTEGDDTAPPAEEESTEGGE
jgi:hypothetical protein